MMNYLINRFLDRFSRRYDYDVSYLRAILTASPAAFRKFGTVSSLSSNRCVVSIEASCAARLVGTMAEDCGPCTQLVVDMAREQGMADEQIAAVLSGDENAMTASAALARRFARAVIGRSADLDTLREQVRAEWGDKGVLDLTFAAQMSRVYPMVKTGLGFAAACRQVRIGSKVLPIGRDKVA